MKLRSVLHRMCLFFSLLTLMNCTSIGPSLLPKNRAGFNGSMITSEEQQLLLNLVRMRFEDRPYFMSVDNIVSSTSISVNGGAGYSYEPSRFSSNSYSILPGSSTSRSLSNSFSLSTPGAFSAGGSYTDSPTVSFTPYQGPKFTTQLMSPFSVSTLLLLLESGRSPEILFRLVISQIGDASNAPLIIMYKPPNLKKFMEIVTLMHELQVEGAIYFQTGSITQIHISAHNAEQIQHKVIRSPASGGRQHE